MSFLPSGPLHERGLGSLSERFWADRGARRHSNLQRGSSRQMIPADTFHQSAEDACALSNPCQLIRGDLVVR